MTIREINKHIATAQRLGKDDIVKRLEALRDDLFKEQREKASEKNHLYKYNNTDFDNLKAKDGERYIVSGKYLNIFTKVAEKMGHDNVIELIKQEQTRRKKQAGIEARQKASEEALEKFIKQL